MSLIGIHMGLGRVNPDIAGAYPALGCDVAATRLHALTLSHGAEGATSVLLCDHQATLEAVEIAIVNAVSVSNTDPEALLFVSFACHGFAVTDSSAPDQALLMYNGSLRASQLLLWLAPARCRIFLVVLACNGVTAGYDVMRLLRLLEKDGLQLARSATTNDQALWYKPTWAPPGASGGDAAIGGNLLVLSASGPNENAEQATSESLLPPFTCGFLTHVRLAGTYSDLEARLRQTVTSSTAHLITKYSHGNFSQEKPLVV